MNIKKTLYVQVIKYNWDKVAKFSVGEFKLQSDVNQRVMTIGEVEFDYEAPNDSLQRFNLFEITELEKIKSKVFAKAEFEITQIDEQIQSLLALENK